MTDWGTNFHYFLLFSNRIIYFEKEKRKIEEKNNESDISESNLSLWQVQ